MRDYDALAQVFWKGPYVATRSTPRLTPRGHDVIPAVDPYSNYDVKLLPRLIKVRELRLAALLLRC